MLQHRATLLLCSLFAFAATFFIGQVARPAPTEPKQRVFEIRTYTTEPGKLPDLLKRFREHTTKLFEKHGMTNIGYWTPTDEPRSQDTLIYILAHDSRDAAAKSWKDFQSDPDWQKARDASEANGKIVHKVESIFAAPTDFSARPAPTADAKQRVFEIRTYTVEPGKLPDLLKLFRDPVIKLFQKHGMTAIGYWVPTDEPRSKDTIIYILAHESRDAAKKSWADFKADPEWIKARKESESGGKIFHKIETVFAAPTDFSAIK